MRILIFGDSIAQGYYDLKLGGWASLLFVDTMQHKARRTDNPTEIFNLAVSGDTTRRIIDRLRGEVDARKWGDEPITLVFAVGINDAMLTDKRQLSSPQHYRAELEELYAIARPLARHIVFVGLTAVHEPESNPWQFNSGASALYWTNERIEKFDKTLENFANDKNAYFVPIFDAFKNAQAQGAALHEDGLHPNAAGHRLIFERVQAVLGKISI